MIYLGFPSGSEVKASACNAGDPGLIPVLGRSPGEGQGNPLQYSYLENPMDRGAWRVTVHRVSKSQTQLKQHTHTGSLEEIELKLYIHVLLTGKSRGWRSLVGCSPWGH